MQFINEDPVHVAVRSELAPLHDDKGRLVREKIPRLFARFQRGTAPGWAQEIGVGIFEFRKIHEGISREKWLSYFDSVSAQQQNGWTDEERELVEEKLLAQGYVRVEPPKLKAPWPAYDKIVVSGRRTIELVAEKIAAKVVEDGYDPAEVAAYERQTLNRVEVLDALAVLGEEKEEAEPLVAA